MTVMYLYDLMARREADLIMRAIARGIVTTDELGAVIPFRTNQGPSIIYQRERSLGTTGFVPDAGTLGTPDSGTDDLVHVPVRRIGRDIDMDSLLDDLAPGEMANQVLKKAKATFRLIGEKLVTGGNTTGFALGNSFQSGVYVDAITAYSAWLDSNRYGPGSLRYTHTGTFLAFRAPGDSQYGDNVACATDGSYTLYSANKNKWITVTLDVSDATANMTVEITFTSSTYEFDGTNRMMSPSMLIASSATDGDAYGLGTLDALIDLEKVRTNRVFFMHSKLRRKHMAALRTLGGSAPEHMQLNGYAGDVLSYRNIPILVNDFIPCTEAKGAGTTLSSVYLASLDASEGLFLGVPGTGNDAIDVDGDPRRNNVLGFRIEQIGALEGAATRRTRVQWYGAPGLGSDLALARASEIITA